ncbi:MAG: hemerythrin domain-containing protein [Acidimicrobiia bacterium]|nr:hemerythrin domain-containing protein [Acidimicrobiia bacterium]
MDIIEHLISEHRAVEDLAEQIRDADADVARRTMFDELEHELRVHMAVEEGWLDPIIRSTLGDDEADETETEHDVLRSALDTARPLVAESGFGAALDALDAAMRHHHEEEESDVFPVLQRDAADRLATLDPEALERQARGEAEDTRTYDELYAAAVEVDLTGRSTMTRDELARALEYETT